MLQWGDTSSGVSWGRLWLYGPPGSGKTVAAACFPDPFFVLVHNENSETSLRGMGRTYRYVKLGVPPEGSPANYTTPIREDAEQLLNMLLVSSAKGTLHQEYGQTLVFDNFSHYNDFVVADVAGEKLSAGGAKPGQMDNPKWGLVRNHYLHLRDVLWRLPMHVIFTSFPSVKMDKTQTVMAAGPMVSGSGGDLVAGSCDAVGYCDQESTGQRVTYFKKWNGFPARHRFHLQGVPEGPLPNNELWRYFGPALGHTA